MDNTKKYLRTEPEDCDICGCPANDFEEDVIDGKWKCPECGHTQ